MPSALVVADTAEGVDRLQSDLKQVGMHVLGASICERMVQDTIRLTPDIVVAMLQLPGPDFFAAAASLDALHPVPVAVFTDDMQVESMERALAAGVSAWVVRGYGVERLRAELQLALVRFRRDRRRTELIAELSGRLEERKLVDRAKGILMSAAQMPEDEAFRTLRAAAMQGRTRVGQVAQRLILAAHSAEAINRAGQLRMLSQRLVKLHALAALGVDPASAGALHTVSVDRLAQNLVALQQLLSAATFGDLLDATLAAWQALEAELASAAPGPGRPAAQLYALDAAAERLLDAAEKLTTALEAASPIGRMQLVNLAGRQRMLAQRVAKLALLDAAAPGRDRAVLATDLQAATSAFEAAMGALRQSAQTTAPARTMLETAQQAWGALRRHLPIAHLPESHLPIAQSSEELLELFDRLAESYEHHMRVLVG